MFGNGAGRSILTIAILAATFTDALPSCHPQQDSYEYVVIGSGAGGGTVASALARKGHTVLLLEAGGDHGEEILQQLPAISPVEAENETV